MPSGMLGKEQNKRRTVKIGDKILLNDNSATFIGFGLQSEESHANFGQMNQGSMSHLNTIQEQS